MLAALGLERGSRFAEAVHFFFYDAPKVLLLLVGVVFVMGVIQTFFSPERTRTLLAGKRLGVGNVLAASLGIVTPFCSCSAVPLFIGFLSAGVPMGVIALSAPEIIILRKVLKSRLIATFVGVVTAGILLVGYVFNLVL